jgi:hypothetical protein
MVHFYRNVFSHVPATSVREVSHMLKAILGDTVLAAQPIQDDADLVFRRKASPRRATDVLHDLCRRAFSGTDFCLIFAP